MYRLKTSRGRILAALFAGACFGAIPAARSASTRAVLAPPLYSVTDLGSLGGTNRQSFALGINDNGQVVGESETNIDLGQGAVATHAFMWQNGALTDLGVLGGSFSTAYEINNQGQVVGYSSTGTLDPGGDDILRATLWQNGAPSNLGVATGGLYSRAYSINEAGVVVGDSEVAELDPDSGYPFYHAARFQNGAVTDLGTLGGGYSHAQGINAAGQAVGWATAAESLDLLAALWQTDKAAPLPPLPSAPESRANEINASGQAAGASIDKGAIVHATLFSGGTATDMGALGGPASHAFGLNDAGQAVGVADTAARNQFVYASHGFIWQGGRIVDLNTQIPLDSGWEIYGVDDINTHGQIVGYGSHNGEVRACLLTPAGPDTRPLSLGYVTLPTFEKAGKRSVGQVQLVGGEAAAQQTGEVVVTLRSSKPKVARVPKQVRVSAGSKLATFLVKTESSLKKITAVTITATVGTQTQELVYVVVPKRFFQSVSRVRGSAPAGAVPTASFQVR